jgi:putative DNA primase/helicase
VNPPEKAETVPDRVPVDPSRVEDLVVVQALADANPSDLGNARRLVQLHGRDLRYDAARRSWLVWDGQRWARDATGAVQRRAKQVVQAIHAEAAAESDSRRRRLLAKHALESEAEPRIRRMVALAESEPGIPVVPAELDVDPWLLNVGNGTLDLRTGMLRPHERHDLLTKLAPVRFDLRARSRPWELFLERVLPEEEVRSFVRRAAGYSLTGSTAEEKLFFAHGPTGTGKSTFLEAMKSTLGDYARTADFSTFLTGRPEAAGGARPDIARLAGARFVASVEVADGRHLAEGMVKLLTGRDTVTVRRLYSEEFEFRPAFTLWLAANHRPKVSDDDGAIWRRILQVPFVVQIPEQERDPALKTALSDPTVSGPAILAWAVRGCLEWQQGGLAPPAAVMAATREYQLQMDPLRDWIEERCTLGGDRTASSADLYRSYGMWARDGGERWTLSRRQFADRLTDRGFEAYKATGGQRARRGIGLVSDQAELGVEGS